MQKRQDNANPQENIEKHVAEILSALKILENQPMDSPEATAMLEAILNLLKTVKRMAIFLEDAARAFKALIDLLATGSATAKRFSKAVIVGSSATYARASRHLIDSGYAKKCREHAVKIQTARFETKKTAKARREVKGLLKKYQEGDTV
jgi:hypothetical protein